jgi:gas vesicle protein
MSDRDEFGAFLVGFVVGGLAGAVTALLLAPQSGEETRTVIKEKAIELKDVATDSYNEAYGAADEFVRTTAGKANEMIKETSVKADELLKETSTKADELIKSTSEKASELGHKGQVVLEEQKSRLTGKKDKPAA